MSSDLPTKILECNPAASLLFQYDNDEIIGNTAEILHVDQSHLKDFQRRLRLSIEKKGFLKDFHFSMKRKDGTIFPSEHTVLELKDSAGNRTGWVSIISDLTEKQQIEERLRQAQKMESIGNLAGGIAHDFNNILFPIIGISEMFLEDLPPDSPERENTEEILKAAKRGGDLVKQILAFSRQTEHKLTPVRIQTVLKEVLKLSRSTIPSNIEINQNIQQDCGLVEADPTQIHQVAMNIITNAYHAVETNGGKIDVTLKEVTIEADQPPNRTIGSGRYALLSVTDTGHGMTPDLTAKIFEPYFTTKKQGKGTGLGLAVVYGIVKEHNGDIKVHSEAGKGTTFNIYLPLMTQPSKTDTDKKNNNHSQRHGTNSGS